MTNLNFAIQTTKVDENYKYVPPTHFNGISIMNVWEWPSVHESKDWTGYISQALRLLWGSFKSNQQIAIAANASKLFNELGPKKDLPHTDNEVKC